jgi:hypothetical protein
MTVLGIGPVFRSHELEEVPHDLGRGADGVYFRSVVFRTNHTSRTLEPDDFIVGIYLFTELGSFE